MTEYWNMMRFSIQVQPMPTEFFEIVVGDIVKSEYGDFLVENIRPDDMMEGKFVNWKNKNGSMVFGTFSRNSLVKSDGIKIYCADCSTESMSKFHYLGFECTNCNSFNTTRT